MKGSGVSDGKAGPKERSGGGGTICLQRIGEEMIWVIRQNVRFEGGERGGKELLKVAKTKKGGEEGGGTYQNQDSIF